MADSMIERMARVIWDVSGRPMKTADIIPAMHPPEAEPDWDRFVPVARSLLAAMRGPTEAMLAAAAECESSLVADVYGAMINAELGKDDERH